MQQQKSYDELMSVEELIAFEQEIVGIFEQGKIHAPVHFSRGNEKALRDIFTYVHPDDWVFSTWRSHYHALLHGIDPAWLHQEILDGNSITINNPEHRFFTSAIVGGILPIAVGVAEALKRKRSPRNVWCFVGDMASMSGIFHESYQWAILHDLPIVFVVENNNWSTDVPTSYAWWNGEERDTTRLACGKGLNIELREMQDVFTDWDRKLIIYQYERQLPHQGSGNWIYFSLLPLFFMMTSFI